MAFSEPMSALVTQFVEPLDRSPGVVDLKPPEVEVSYFRVLSK